VQKESRILRLQQRPYNVPSRMYLLYSALLAAAMVLAMPFWLWQILRHGKYRTGFNERWGKHISSDEATPPKANAAVGADRRGKRMEA